MNINIISEKLKEYEHSFYKEKEKIFMEKDNYLKYIKYVDTKDYASTVLEFQLKTFLFFIFALVNNFIINSLAWSVISYFFFLFLFPYL